MKGLWLTSEVVTNIRVYELQFIDSGTGTRTRGAERPEVLVSQKMREKIRFKVTYPYLKDSLGSDI